MARKPLFLGYRVFFHGEPMAHTGLTVSTDKVYLKAQALSSLYRIKDVCDPYEIRRRAPEIERLWKDDLNLTLREVYAH